LLGTRLICPPRAPTVRRRWHTAACLVVSRSVAATPSPAETAAATAVPSMRPSSQTRVDPLSMVGLAVAPTAGALPDAGHRQRRTCSLSVRLWLTARPTLPPRRCVPLRADPYGLPQALRSTHAALRSGAPSCHAPEAHGKRHAAASRRRPNRTIGNHIELSSHPAYLGSGPLRRAAGDRRSGGTACQPPTNSGPTDRSKGVLRTPAPGHAGDPWPRPPLRHGAHCGAPQPESAGSGPAPARGACPRSAHRLALALAS
jgi:hypothetical protein